MSSKVIRAGKCICISDTHQKYKLGTVYAFELKGYSKITYVQIELLNIHLED